MNEQLENQLKELKPGNPILIVGNFLKNEFEKDEQLSKDFTKNAIQMNELWAYIVGEAKKKAENGSCCMADAEVFGLAIHYIHDGYKETLAKKKAEVSEEEKYSSYPTIEELQEQAKKREAESKAKKDEERRKKALEKQEAKRKASGQLSIFDFMNEA